MSDQLGLQVWNDRLAAHFKELSARRQQSGWPLFALEHGLSPTELAQFEHSVRQNATRRSPENGYYLSWVVYAAEFGYRYSGDQYWQSFTAETPGWKDKRADREFIRHAFTWFANAYNGVRPEGTWAEFFTNIAWPITHGVLPKDLQRQLVKLLYDTRFSLRQELFASAATLGNHLRAESQDAGQRFRVFAENALLLGQIAAALLTQEQGDDKLLSAATLARIVDDIGREKISKDRLSDARSSAKKLRVKGLASREDQSADLSKKGNNLDSEQSEKIGPPASRLLLRFHDEAKWDLLLEVPDLALFARTDSSLRAFLSDTRARVFGASVPTIARGRLMGAGNQQFVLTHWPVHNEPLIAFDSDDAIRHSLEPTFSSATGDRLLFRVRDNGYALRSKELVVYPGQSYVLLRHDFVANPPPGCRVVSVSCEGWHGLGFSVPENISDTWTAVLMALGLQAVKTLRVWPAGTPPAHWDGLGQAEWITDDVPILALALDHGLESVELTLTGGSPHHVKIPAGDQGNPIYLSFGALPNGDYTLRVNAEDRQSPESPLLGYLAFRIRPPGQTSKVAAQRALRVRTNPTLPSLEEIWENRVELAVLGPIETKLAAKIQLRSKSENQPLFSKNLTGQRLPLDPASWSKWFEREVLQDRKAQRAYDAASNCLIEFQAGLLGADSIRAEREFTPLRWGVQVLSDRSVVRLFDDSGAMDATVTFYDFRTPTKPSLINYESVISGLTVAAPGGLYLAASRNHRAGAVIDLTLGKVQLAQLRVQPIVPPMSNNIVDARNVLAVAADWERARLKGSALGALHKSSAIKALMSACFSALCGNNWGKLEQRLISGDADATEILQHMKRAISDKSVERSIGDRLDSVLDDLAAMSARSRVSRFASLAMQCIPGIVGGYAETAAKRGHDPTNLRRRATSGLFDFALKVSSSPEAALNLGPEEFNQGLSRLIERPVLARAARYLVLRVDGILSERTAPSGTAYSGWQW